LQKLPIEKQKEIYCRIEQTIENYDLKSSGDTFAQTFACPLFEKEIGCLVHASGKTRRVHSACVLRKQTGFAARRVTVGSRNEIERLNEQTYKTSARWLSLPVFLHLVKRG
jgi:hypothetical protein